MRWLVGLSALLAAVVLLSTPGSSARTARQAPPACMENPLGPLPGYSAITRGDFNQQNTEADGRLVIGGNCDMTNVGVATKLVTDPRADRSRDRRKRHADQHRRQPRQRHLRRHDHAGELHGAERHGDEGRAAVQSHSAVRWARDPLDVMGGARGQRQRERRSRAACRSPAPTRCATCSRVSQALLDQSSALYLKVPDDSTTVINLTGGSFQNPFGGGMFVWDEATGYTQLSITAPNQDLENRRRQTLWNFPNAVSVTLGPPGTAWQGTVLAPRASVQLTYQHIFGSIAAASISGTGEIGAQNPNPCLPDPTPCPQPSPTPSPTTTPTSEGRRHRRPHRHRP